MENGFCSYLRRLLYVRPHCIYFNLCLISLGLSLERLETYGSKENMILKSVLWYNTKILIINVQDIVINT